MARKKVRSLTKTPRASIEKMAEEMQEGSEKKESEDHTKVTLYIRTDQIFALEDIRRKRIIAGAKLGNVDKPKLMREAVDLPMEKENIKPQCHIDIKSMKKGNIIMAETPIYDLKALERKLKINRRTLREYIKHGELEAAKIGRSYYITEPKLIAFVDSRG